MKLIMHKLQNSNSQKRVLIFPPLKNELLLGR